MMTEYLNELDFPPADAGVYVQPVCQGHGYHCEFSFFYDRDDHSERQKVRDLYLSLGTALMNNGAFFSRPYDLLADHVFNRDAVTRETLRKIKDVFGVKGSVFRNTEAMYSNDIAKLVGDELHESDRSFRV